MKKCDVSARKTFQGAWECSAIVGDHLVSRQYFGYPKREAVRQFVREVNSKAKE